jgi:hypothetical protein
MTSTPRLPDEKANESGTAPESPKNEVIEDELNEGLEESFPASDPPSITQPGRGIPAAIPEREASRRETAPVTHTGPTAK